MGVVSCYRAGGFCVRLRYFVSVMVVGLVICYGERWVICGLRSLLLGVVVLVGSSD